MANSISTLIRDIMNGKSNFGDDTILSSTVAAATATVAIAVVGCWVIFSPSSLENKGNNKQRHKHNHNNGKNKENRDCDRLRVPRRWSCMSESMAHGTFPTNTKFNEAIINAVLIFDDNDRPTMDEIVEQCVPILFQYERFSTVFDRTTNFAYYSTLTTTTTSKEGKEEEEAKGTNANTNGGIDPYDMVRVVNVSNCLTEDDIVKELESHACVPLADAPRGNLLPWWEFVLLENKNTSTSTSTSTGKSAVIWRIHHSLGDGIALVQLVQEIFTNAKTGQKLGAAAAAAASKNTTTTATNDTSKKFQIHRSPLEWVTQSCTALATVLTLPMSRFDDSTIFHKTPSPTTSVHHHPRYSSPNDMVYSSKQTIIPFMSIPLEFVKRLKTAASASASASTSTSNNDTRSGSGGDVDVVVHKIKKNVTVNDVLFTIISQALHDYLKEENDIMLESKGEDLLCRALLPVALPRPKTDDKSRALRNLWCFISCDLSVGTGTTSTSSSGSGSGSGGSDSGSGTNQQNQILDRLWKIHERLAILKKGLVPLVSFTVSKLVMKWLPRLISRDQTLQLFSRHSMVFSNVPGPAEPVSFANHEVLSVQMIHMNLIPQLSFLSYRGMIFGNVIVPPPTDNGHDHDHDEHIHNNNNSNNDDDDDDDDVTATMSRRRRERLPLHVSNALVLLASKLGLQVNDVPVSLRDHAAQL